MKKAILLLVSALLAMNVMAQQEIRLRSADRAECISSDYQQLRATFSFSTLTAEEVSTTRGQFSRLSMPNTVIGGNEGDPLIPVVNELVAVPFGVQPTIRVTSYSTTDYRLGEQGIHTLVPRQPSLRKDQNPEEQPFVYNAAAYQTRGLRSEPRAMVNVVGTMRGIQLGKMTIEPVSYDPVGNILRVFNDIEVEVSFDGADAQATQQMLIDTYSPYFDAVYKQMFNGRAVLDAYTEHPDLYTTPVKMLVVTTEKYSTCDAFNNWLIWKKQKGIDVDVQLVTPETTAADVRSLIQSRYNANHPTFLVIIGDREDVTNYTEYEVSGNNYNPYVSDNQYASIDSDVYHDMFMSRMSVSTTEELANLVNKTLQYEQYTMPDKSYLNKALFIAGKDSTYGYHNTYGIPTVHYAANYYFNADHGFTDIYMYDNPDSYAGCYSNLNTGVGFFNYTGHGLINGLSNPAFMTNGSYTYTVEKISNTDKYFWLMACCCLSANWGYHNNYSTELNVSVGEALIRSDKGAFGYIGSVPETYWSEDYYFGVGATSTTGQTPTMEQTKNGVYDAMFMDDNWNTLNSMPFFGNVAVTYSHANGYYHSTDDEYYWRAYQCLGDGSVMPYLVEPVTNNVSHESNLNIGVPTFTVNADAGSYVSITFNNEIIGVAQVPAAGTVDVPISGIGEPGEAMIVVTRQQRQPYIGTITVEGVGEPFDITCNPAEHGTISAQAQAYAGALITLTATPDAGYCHDSWEVRDANNNLVSVAGNKFVMPESNVTVSATFVPGYTVTLASVMNGSINANILFAKQGSSIALTAKPDAGCVFDSWVVFKTGDVNTTIEVNDNSFTMPNYDVTVSAIFLSQQSGGEVTIGSGNSSGSTLPSQCGYRYSLSQQIYTSYEVGEKGTISAISFRYYDNSPITRNFDIYLSHTNQSSLSKCVAQQITDRVYSGAVTFESNGWYTIPLDTPFEYDGTSNLLLTVDDNTGNAESYVKFYTYSSNNYMAVYYGGYNDLNPLSPPNGIDKTKNRNQIKITKAAPGYLSISSNELSGFTYVVGEGPTTAQGVAIIGANLQGNLTITAPSGYEVSQTEAGTYSATVTMTPNNGSLQEMVYVRLAAGNAEGSYNGMMTIASGNANASVSLNGEVSTSSIPQVPQAITFSQGWTWWSAYINITLSQLEEAMGNKGLHIVSQDGSLSYLSGSGWDGSLSALEPTKMYMIETNAQCSFTLNGTAINPADHPITLAPGFTWIAYPLSQAMNVNAALAGLDAQEGDIIKSMTAMAMFNGTTWEGTLTTLEPGKGYIYKSNASENKTFTFPSSGNENQSK